MSAPNIVAVNLMTHLCNHDWHGYDQTYRNGDGEGYCDIAVDGRVYKLAQGDRDCSSAVIECWKKALEPTKYKGKLDGATYTGNMREVFVNSGLFEWKPMSFTAQPGDIYLNERDHTAMCISVVPDMLAQFSLNEFGGITGGKVGDQTGNESSIQIYYDYPWGGILHYIGGDLATTAANTGSLPIPKYRVYTSEDGWLPWMEGLKDTDGSSDDFAGVPGHQILAVEFASGSLGQSGWFAVTKNDKKLARGDNGLSTDGDVTGVTVYYDTPNPGTNGYHVAKYRVAPVGKSYLKWEYDDQDDGAGGAGTIDRMQCIIEKV